MRGRDHDAHPTGAEHALDAVLAGKDLPWKNLRHWALPLA
jgi:hypothetical protein